MLKNTFMKSSYCGSLAGMYCVEVAKTNDGGVLVRDSKNPDHTILKFTHHEWKAFVQGVKNNEFDV